MYLTYSRRGKWFQRTTTTIKINEANYRKKTKYSSETYISLADYENAFEI